nr:uncharacterized protein [uncultured bacterium]
MALHPGSLGGVRIDPDAGAWFKILSFRLRYFGREFKAWLVPEQRNFANSLAREGVSPYIPEDSLVDGALNRIRKGEPWAYSVMRFW